MSKQNKKNFSGSLANTFNRPLVPTGEQTPPPAAEMPDPVNPKVEEQEQTEDTTSKAGRPAKYDNEKRPASEKGLPEGYKRHSLIVDKDQLEALLDIAYWDRTTLKDLVYKAFNYIIHDYQVRNDGKAIDPRPEKK